MGINDGSKDWNNDPRRKHLSGNAYRNSEPIINLVSDSEDEDFEIISRNVRPSAEILPGYSLRYIGDTRYANQYGAFSSNSDSDSDDEPSRVIYNFLEPLEVSIILERIDTTNRRTNQTSSEGPSSEEPTSEEPSPEEPTSEEPSPEEPTSEKPSSI